MQVTHARMAWAASTVGAAPVGLGGIRRPRAEATWRAAMVEATLGQTRAPRRWIRTAAYNRLDPSEKSAISYFHGMVGARLLTEGLLCVPLLVHLDAALAHMGATTRKSRPDFVGYHPATGAYSLALEAKGRSRGWSDQPLVRAKAQAGLLPKVVRTTTTITAASLMFFSDDLHWSGHLEDPPAQQSQIKPLELGLVTSQYYLPIVHALVDLGDRDLDVGSGSVHGYLRESGIAFSVPRFIFDPLSTIPIRERVDSGQLVQAGERIAATWRRSFGGLIEDGPESEVAKNTIGLPRPSIDLVAILTSPTDATEGPSDAIEERSWTGTDLITVEVDQPWSAALDHD